MKSVDPSIKFISKLALIRTLKYIIDVSKKTNPKQPYTLMAKERFEADLAYVIDLVEVYPDLPESKYILPEFFKEDS